jgi:hypothetical protein
MSENLPQDLGSTWATMASRKVPSRVLQPGRKQLAVKDSVPLVGSVLYEDGDLKHQILASKAMAIVQQALTSGSVLFSFGRGIFGDRIEAYKMIQSQISAEVEFRPISLYDNKDDGSLLIEAKFDRLEDASVAMNSGVTHKGIVYKASSTRETKEFGDLKHVQFTLMRIVKDPAFVGKLLESLSYFGRVLQIKQFTRGGFFEGKFSVMLDTSVGYQVGDDESMEARPLGRMLYLSEFDCFVSAAYKGAPPVCHFCRRSGHIRAKCPDLAQRTCFGCNKPGHMVRYCPEAVGKQPEYVKKQKVSHDTAQAQQETVAVLTRIQQEKMGEIDAADITIEVVGTDSDAMIAESSGDNDQDAAIDGVGKAMQTESYVDEQDEVMIDGKSHGATDKKETPSAKTAYQISSAASRYASDEVAVDMVVDKPADMLKMSTLQSRTQEKLKAFDAKLKAGSRLSGFSGASKAGDKRPITTRNARGAQ